MSLVMSRPPHVKWDNSQGAADFLHLVGQGGSILGGIDSSGLGQGSLLAVSPLISSIPGIPGTTAVPVQSGLIAEYRILPTESPASLIDYSGNGNNATGTVGTVPTIVAGSGGISCNGAGAVILPAALNSAKTIQVFCFQILNAFNSCPVLGNGNGAASGGTGILFSVNGLPAFGPAIANGAAKRISSVNGGVLVYAQTKSAANFAPINVALVMDTLDRLYVNGIERTLNYFTLIRSSAGAQTTGAYQLGGAATGLNTSAYFGGFIYYAVFYNRVLSSSEIMQNSVFIYNQMVLRSLTLNSPVAPINLNFQQTGTNDQYVADGDSITQGGGGAITNPWPSILTLNGSFQVSNQGLSGLTMAGMLAGADQAVDPFYSPNAARNVITIWGGTNDNAVTAEPALRSYCQNRRAIGWKTLVMTML